ncbi:unnamed protein product [Meganyctiphanes norvegica]|uniref:Uncharacterized protein n=1 Tax=Meganyctiphanes norvegica TaxID=48144 RepID=A0AAV2SCD3_MEGNR
MDQQTIILLITALLTTAAVQLTTAWNTCYYCSDDPSWIGSDWYDTECAAYDYRGLTVEHTGTGCYIRIYDSGYVSRGPISGDFEDGDCYHLRGYITCFCKDKNCNTDSYCEQCFSTLTPSTPEQTTVTTTEPLTSTYTTTTAEPTSPTTDASPATTIDPAANLSCYNCMNCASVDEDTTPTIEDNFLSCSTILVLESGLVIRGGSYDAHPDGECVTNTATVQCWCTSDICTRNSIRY